VLPRCRCRCHGGGGGGTSAAAAAPAVVGAAVVVVGGAGAPRCRHRVLRRWVVVYPPVAIVAAAVMVVVVCGLTHLLTWHPCCLSCVLYPSFLSLLTPIPPCNNPGRLPGCPSFVVGVGAGREMPAVVLAEFQTPTFFDRDSILIVAHLQGS